MVSVWLPGPSSLVPVGRGGIVGISESNMNNNQENIQFWSSLLHSLADSDPKDHFPEISSPVMVMSTSMAIDVSPKPFNAHGDGHKAVPQKSIAETGDKGFDEGGQRSAEKQIELKEGEKEEIKNLGKSKRPRTNEARNIAEKMTKLAMTKLQNVTIQSQSMGPMLPLGMKMDFPAPWFPSFPPNFIRPPFNCFTPGETSCACCNQIVEPATTKGFNNQPHSSRSM
ncbi:hypothetical protein Bca4012_057008 [Brassica carinata]